MESLINGRASTRETAYGTAMITKAYEGGGVPEMKVGVPATGGRAQLARERRQGGRNREEIRAEIPREQEACCPIPLVPGCCTKKERSGKWSCFCWAWTVVGICMFLALLALAIAWGVTKNKIHHDSKAVSGEEVFDFTERKSVWINKEVCIELQSGQEADIDLFLLETPCKDTDKGKMTQEISGKTDDIHHQADLYFYWLQDTGLTIDIDIDSNAIGYVRLINDKQHKLGENCRRPKSSSEEWVLKKDSATRAENGPEQHYTIVLHISVSAHYHLCFWVENTVESLNYSLSVDLYQFETVNSKMTKCNPTCCGKYKLDIIKELENPTCMYAQTMIPDDINDSEKVKYLSVPYYLNITYSKPRSEVIGVLAAFVVIAFLSVLLCACYTWMLRYKRSHDNANWTLLAVYAHP